MELAQATAISPELANPILEGVGSTEIHEPTRVADLARRPEVQLSKLLTAAGHCADTAEAEWASIELRYRGYIERERQAAERLGELEEFEIPESLAFAEVTTLSSEAREKLARQRPRSLGAAGRIPGVSPSDLQNLVFEVIKQRNSGPS